jgi:dihydroorotase
VNVVIEIPRPDDWHVHLRDDSMLAAVVEYTAKRFRYAMVMPNLAPPITTVAQAISYRQRILAAAPPAYDFVPLLTLYCTADLHIDEVRRGHEQGIVKAVKYYPAGATTNSDAGGSALADFMALFEAMAHLGVRLLVHAESTDPAIDIFDREAAFLEGELAPLCESIPELGVTVEHVSTQAGVDFVADHPQVAASVTPHHLARERSHLLADGMRPDLYCKPIINSAADQAALVAAVTSGDPAFFLGTDSAPHSTLDKYAPRAKAGVFNAAYGLEVVAEVFARADSIDTLSAFVSSNGCAVYEVEPPTETLTLERREVPEELPGSLRTATGDEVVLFGVEEARLWTIRSI